MERLQYFQVRMRERKATTKHYNELNEFNVADNNIAGSEFRVSSFN